MGRSRMGAIWTGGWVEGGVKGGVGRANQASHNMTSKPTLITRFGEIFWLCYYRVKSVKILQIVKMGQVTML